MDGDIISGLVKNTHLKKTFFVTTKMPESCPMLSLIVSLVSCGFALAKVETQSWTVVTGLAAS